MKTNHIFFDPDLISLLKCMLQGFVGGVFGAMVLMLLYLIFGSSPASFIVVLWAVVPIFVGGVLGTIKAIPFWTVNHLIKSPLSPLARVVAGGFVPTSLWLFVLIREGAATNETIIINAGVVSLITLPTSLLIGSGVRPEKFFMIGCTDHPVALGRLPLRLLCTGALLFCVLAVASWQLLGEDVQQDVMFRYFPLVYFSLSLFLTFKAPPRTVLLIISLGLNAPLIAGLYMSNEFQVDYGWVKGQYAGLIILCTMVLAAWAVFVATQLSVSSKKVLRTYLAPAFPRQRNLDHQCLGARFLEWHEHVF